MLSPLVGLTAWPSSIGLELWFLWPYLWLFVNPIAIVFSTLANFSYASPFVYIRVELASCITLVRIAIGSVQIVCSLAPPRASSSFSVCQPPLSANILALKLSVGRFRQRGRGGQLRSNFQFLFCHLLSRSSSSSTTSTGRSPKVGVKSAEITKPLYFGPHNLV